MAPKFEYRRRPTVEVRVGRTGIGGHNPVRLQSMASTSTMDTDSSVDQASRIADAGAELVRFTAQGVREADNLAAIREKLRERGYDVPLVADIHFNPKAAFAAAESVEKVRINPGNFIDPGRTFRKMEFTGEEYAAELRKLEDSLAPFIEKCRANGTAVRLGVNHGSLSDRIMSRYGDTPAGMVESAMEFLRVFRGHGFDDVVISIKASNVVVMVTTVLMLVRAMDDEGMSYPLHLGVTEAGDGEDARVKSALGIGTLLAMGIGDTIRVSLSEEPERELPVARAIAEYVRQFDGEPVASDVFDDRYNIAGGNRRVPRAVGVCGNGKPVVVGADSRQDYTASDKPDLFLDTDGVDFFRLDAQKVLEGDCDIPSGCVVLLYASGEARALKLLAAMHRLSVMPVDNPVVLCTTHDGLSATEVAVRSAIDFGPALLSGFVDGVMVESDSMSAEERARLAFGILQSARLRFTRTEYIACPGCGRTLFNLHDTLAEVKAATSHLKGLKIGVMGCIVNGPGEMADADYGYVGAGVGKVSLYKGKQCIEKNIPANHAVQKLVELIKDCGDWK